jgi:hypothetical protein
MDDAPPVRVTYTIAALRALRVASPAWPEALRAFTRIYPADREPRAAAAAGAPAPRVKDTEARRCVRARDGGVYPPGFRRYSCSGRRRGTLRDAAHVVC